VAQLTGPWGKDSILGIPLGVGFIFPRGLISPELLVELQEFPSNKGAGPEGLITEQPTLYQTLVMKGGTHFGKLAPGRKLQGGPCF